jgi:hypothetical protein
MTAISTSTSSLPVTLRIKNKKFITHFVPKRVYAELTGSKKIKFSTQNRTRKVVERQLKTGKIIEVFNMLVNFYYMKEVEEICLCSSILRENYGTNYNYYMDYLISKGIIRRSKNHSQGNHSRSYMLNLAIFKEGLRRYQNSEKFVVKNWIDRRLKYLTMCATSTTSGNNSTPNLSTSPLAHSSTSHGIPTFVKNKLIEDLYHIELNYAEAHKELISMYQKNELTDTQYYKNFNTISLIDGGDIFFKEDDFGRFHTNFTTLKTCIRAKHITIDGEEVSEIDITNSQPMFLSILLKNNGFDTTYNEEYIKFKHMVKNGAIYETFIETYRSLFGNDPVLERAEAKKMLYIVMFGCNKIRHGSDEEKKANKVFKTMFPNIWKWIRHYKRSNNNHKLVAHELQRSESNLIFGEICYTIKKNYPNIRLFTVHDSIYFAKKYLPIVENIFYNRVDLVFNN